ncbi:MAG TPA: ATP-binding protein [Gaiellaceae bacterium]|nr:ATP-binding protein [Gaiellaceae bacterium]
MAGPFFPASYGEATAESERVVAWLRFPAIALIALGQGLEHPNPEETGFLIMLAIYSAWSAGVLAWVHLRPAGERFALLATAVDIAAISMLAVLSGGAFSHARLAFFLVPVAVAFRFRPAVTSAAVVVTTAAYVIQAAAHPAAKQPQAVRFIVTQAGFLAWVGVACVLLSLLLARRTQLVARLADARSHLLADALEAEQRERKRLAEALHDHAIQNLLSARHELEEAEEAQPHPALARADDALVETVGQLREAVFDLHPYVLEQAGLEAALRSIAQQAAARAHLRLTLDLRYQNRHPQEQLVFSAARELLANVVGHAEASDLTLRLREEDDVLELVVEDDGRGFTPGRLAERLADGHIGLATQRFRVESAGGRLDVLSKPGVGTRVAVRLPS